MPNIKILNKFNRSLILEAIEASNQMKVDRDASSKNVEVAVAPMKAVDKVAV